MIYDKDPLSNYSKVQKVWIDGNKYFDRDSDVSGRPAKELEKKKLADKEKAATPARGRKEAAMKKFGLLMACAVAACAAANDYVLHSRRGRLSGDGRGDEGRFGAGAGREDRRYRGEARGAEGHEGRRRQRPAGVSGDDRFEYTSSGSRKFRRSA